MLPYTLKLSCNLFNSHFFSLSLYYFSKLSCPSLLHNNVFALARTYLLKLKTSSIFYESHKFIIYFGATFSISMLLQHMVKFIFDIILLVV
jgi:hypothetical protein